MLRKLLVRSSKVLTRFGFHRKVLEVLDASKGRGNAEYGLDETRARCLLQLGEPWTALEVVREELRAWPDNESAKALEASLAKKYRMPEKYDDPEFRELMDIIAPHTMLSEERAYAIFTQTKRLLKKNDDCVLVECGVAGGGSTLLMGLLLKRHDPNSHRRLVSFDTFSGMPQPSDKDLASGRKANDTHFGKGTCRGSLEHVRGLLEQWGCVNRVELVPGLFEQTLPKFRQTIGPIALLHADGDWYESTKTILENFYDLLIPGGYLQIDDYGYWDGCRQAVDEFMKGRPEANDFKKLDFTGVGVVKPQAFESEGGADTGDIKPCDLGVVEPSVSEPERFTEPERFIDTGDIKLCHLGCGKMVHSDWINADLVVEHPNVHQVNVLEPLPFRDDTFDAVYHSHMLEHLPWDSAPAFLRECWRILRPGGTLRIAVPDLEGICRVYLEWLEKAAAGDDPIAEANVEWMCIELIDQIARRYSGGAMWLYLCKQPLLNESFISDRLGQEYWSKKEIMLANQHDWQRQGFDPLHYLILQRKDPKKLAAFLEQGEVHQWMYDRVSLRRLVVSAGFDDFRVVQAGESAIAKFAEYGLEKRTDGSVRKPDSIFIECTKPLVTATAPDLTPFLEDKRLGPWLEGMPAIYEKATSFEQAYSMTTPYEHAALESYAAQAFQGRGRIVDLGCWFGGTTTALSQGLKQNPNLSPDKVTIEAYDIFMWEDWMNPIGEPMGLTNLKDGDCFYDRVKEQLKPWAEWVDLRKEDLMAFQDENPGKIEMLFVDANKNWKLANNIYDQFFPKLIPGCSIIGQQDFFWGDAIVATCVLSMWELRDSCPFIHAVPNSCSALFFCKELPPPAGSLRSLRNDLPCEDVEAAFDWAERLTEQATQIQRAALCGLCYMVERGFFQQALARLQRLRYRINFRIEEWQWPTMEQTLEKANAPGHVVEAFRRVIIKPIA